MYSRKITILTTLYHAFYPARKNFAIRNFSNSLFLQPRLNEFVPGVTGPDVAPGAVRLQQEPLRWNRLDHSQVLLGFQGAGAKHVTFAILETRRRISLVLTSH